MSGRFNNLSFKQFKQKGIPIAMMTAYDYTSALLCDQAEVDVLLVGDSLAMVMLGHEDTLSVTMDEMLHHVKAVRRGSPQGFIVADMPYLSYHISVEKAVENAGRMLAEGRANAVKIEGGRQFSDVIAGILRAQIPVVGHLGLTPQSVNAFGGYRVQGRQREAIEALVADAKALEALGVSAIVLECVPPDVAAMVTRLLSIPTIGIGAGLSVDGQVLVFHDALGFYDRMRPKFVKTFADGHGAMLSGLKAYVAEVKTKAFPEPKHQFADSDIQLDTLY